MPLTLHLMTFAYSVVGTATGTAEAEGVTTVDVPEPGIAVLPGDTIGKNIKFDNPNEYRLCWYFSF